MTTKQSISELIGQPSYGLDNQVISAEIKEIIVETLLNQLSLLSKTSHDEARTTDELRYMTISMTDVAECIMKLIPTTHKEVNQ